MNYWFGTSSYFPRLIAFALVVGVVFSCPITMLVSILTK